MTAVLRERLSALLSDLGIAHKGDPSPVRREVQPADARAYHPSDLITVMVETADLDAEALRAAGLRDVSSALGTVVTGQIRVEHVPLLAEAAGVVSVEVENRGRAEIHSSVPATRADLVRTGPLGLTGAGVIVGVVDSGIDIFHQAFRTADGKTRLKSLLDLTAPHTLTPTGTPTGGTFQLGWTPPTNIPNKVPGAGTEQLTPPIAFNATAPQVLAALGTIAAIKPGDVAVTGGPLPGAPIVVSFQGQYLHKDVDPPVRKAPTLTPAGTDITVVTGREYTEQRINDALGAPPGVFMSWDLRGHGTHVMGIAAGDGSQAGNCKAAGYFVGVAPEAELVAVKTSLTDSDDLRGIQHVFAVADRRAIELGHPVAAVVNLSFGASFGARDGSTQLEKGIDSALAANPPGRVIVKSAGNNGDRHDHSAPKPQYFEDGSATHSRKTVPANGTATMTAVVNPGDESDDRFDFYYKGAGRLSVTIKAPLSPTTVGPVAAGPVQNLQLHGHAIRVISQLNESGPGTHNIFVRIAPPAKPPIRAGEWMFTLTETAGTEVDVHCWVDVEKKDEHPRFTNADQDRGFTISPPGTARRIITVADYDHRDNKLASTSSRGPTTDTRTGFDTKPDIAAPGEGIMAAKSGVANDGACCDCCYDFYTSKSGTSMSAPHITGIVALMLQRNRTLTWQQARDHLRMNADPPDPITGPTLPNTEWGAGIVNAEKAVTAVPALTVSGDSPWVASVAPTIAAGSAPRRRTVGLDELRAAALRTDDGRLAYALVSTHISEVIRLVNADRRVIVAWHRLGGPALLHAALDPYGDPLVTIPEMLTSADAAPRLERFIDALRHAGSLRLRTDIERHREFLLALPGIDLAGLPPIDVAG